MSILGILNIGTTALLASKSALNTTSNNIANASTPGYTRQSVVLSSLPSGMTSSTGASGNGVLVSDVTRMYDSFTSLQLRTEKSASSYWNTYSNYAGSVENVFNETSDTGIGPAITNFFNAWQQVAQDPGNTVPRTSLIDAGQYLASRISGAYNTLADQQTQIYKNSQDLVTQVNNISQQIYNLNEKIVSSPGALDLKDQRDNLVEQLNQITRVSTVEDGSGRYNIYLGGSALVDATGSYNMSVSLDVNNAMQFSVGSTNVNTSMSSGQLKANLDARDTTIAGYIDQLNTFATDFSTAINAKQDTGYDLNGALGNVSGSSFFSVPTAFAARDIKVDLTDPRLIAASGSAAGVPGDNTNAQAIADLASSAIVGGSTPTDFYSKMVADAGADAQSANTYVKFQTSLVNQLETQRQSTSGVSLDEEAVNLVQYQKSFEAAAKMISVGNDLLDTIIGMVR
jgi:flagellar hook-associated protein 1 FlgK